MPRQNKISIGDSFAVHTGTYAGEILILIKETADNFCFLSIPKMINRDISKLIIENARNKNIIKFVEKIPRQILNVSNQQYLLNEKSHNRREQSHAPDLLDSEKPSTRR